MKIQTFILIIAILTGVFALISLFKYSISLSKNKEKSSSMWAKLGVLSMNICIILLIAISFFSGKMNYNNILKVQEFDEIHGLPQLDSTMVNFGGSNSTTLYISCSKDSVFHRSKSIDYDILDVNSVSDQFYNYKENLCLESKFINQNIFRDSANFYILTKLNDTGNTKADTISKQSFDNYILDWGLSDKIYTKFDVFFPR